MGSAWLYHVSRLAYLPHLLESGEFRPAVHLPFRCEERVRHVFERRGYAEEQIATLLPKALEQPGSFLNAVHEYFWITDQLTYGLRKARRSQKHIVYVDSPFSTAGEPSSPIIYIFERELRNIGKWHTEAIVSHRRPLRFLRATIGQKFGRNYVTKQVVPFTHVRAALVDGADAVRVTEHMKGIFPVVGVLGMKNGRSVRSATPLEARITELLQRGSEEDLRTETAVGENSQFGSF